MGNYCFTNTFRRDTQTTQSSVHKILPFRHLLHRHCYLREATETLKYRLNEQAVADR